MERPEPASHHGHHSHEHVAVDPTLLTSQRGIRAIQWSFFGLMVTSLLQVIVVCISGSVALLADTIHNFGDALTAIPLWVAFRLVRKGPSRRFTYGYGKVEDLAGVFVVLLILLSAVVAGYESLNRLLHPQPIGYLGAVAVASFVGFLGNELVAVLRIRAGKEIHSAALVADGTHARVDGLTSLAVLGGVIGYWLGYPMADAIIGLFISILILRISWSSARSVFLRIIDGVDPKVVDEIYHAAVHVGGVADVAEIRVRWIGHRLHAEVNLAVSPEVSIVKAHALSQEARHVIMHQLPYLSNVVIHVDPSDASGEAFHRIDNHEHDDSEPHFHP